MRYLVHSPINFFNYQTTEELLNRTNTSIGEVFSIWSLCNTIMTDSDTIILNNFYRHTKDLKKFIKYANTFDYVVLPMGGIFQKNNAVKLENLTTFLKGLNTKVICIGIGCQLSGATNYDDFLSDGMDDIIKTFMNEALMRSNIVGITDRYSSQILTKLGFVEGKDYCVCGDPGMFYNGNKIHMLSNIFPKSIKGAKLCFSRDLFVSKNSNDNGSQFFEVLCKTNKQSYTLSNRIIEYLSLLFQDDLQIKKFYPEYSYKKLTDLRYRMIPDVESLLEELSQFQMYLGENVGDCLAAIYTGLPSILITSNSLKRGIAEYHKIPYIRRNELNSNDVKNLRNVNGSIDGMVGAHMSNYNRYIGFFNTNNIKTADINLHNTAFRYKMSKKHKDSLNLEMDIPLSYFTDEVKSGHYVSSKRKQVWAIELDILNKIQKLCAKNDIKYYMDAGTLLGAVRHKGFIPWDDDIDIVMFPEDYDKFLKIAKVDLKPYFPQDYIDTPKIYNIKVRNSNTTFLTEPAIDWRYPYNQGLFVDVSRLDNVPDDEHDYRKFVRNLRLIKEETNARYGRWWEYEQDKISLPDAAYDLRKKFEDLSKSYNATETETIAVLANPSGNPFRGQELRKYKSEYSDVIMMDFEMLKLPAPIGYDSILKRLYDDYMVIRKGAAVHGKMYTDPVHSYTTYIKPNKNESQENDLLNVVVFGDCIPKGSCSYVYFNDGKLAYGTRTAQEYLNDREKLPILDKLQLKYNIKHFCQAHGSTSAGACSKPKWAIEVNPKIAISYKVLNNDLSQYDKILIFCGTGEYPRGIFSDGDDSTNYTTKGAMKLMLNHLKTNYPDKQTIFILPGYSPDKKDKITFEEHNEMLKSLIEEYGCEYISFYDHIKHLVKDKRIGKMLFPDGRHPSIDCMHYMNKWIGDKIDEKLTK